MARRALKSRWTPPPGYYRAWRKKNRARLSAYAKEHRTKNQKRYAKTAKAWRAKNRDKINARRSETRLIGGLITGAQYDVLLRKQKGVCAICKGSPEIRSAPGHTRRRILCVDHDHKTLKVRGLLCHHCNAGIGHFQDRPDFLKAAIRYLGKKS